MTLDMYAFFLAPYTGYKISELRLFNFLLPCLETASEVSCYCCCRWKSATAVI